jgi:hypothetical protein
LPVDSLSPTLLFPSFFTHSLFHFSFCFPCLCAAGEWLRPHLLAGLRLLMGGDGRTLWTRPFTLSLLYRASRDGHNAAAFHARCDGKGPTLTALRSANGCVFGGFAAVGWASGAAWVKAPGSWLFSLVGVRGSRPLRMDLVDANDEDAVFHYSGYGPIFGAGKDLRVCWPSSHYSQPSTYRMVR